MCLQVAETVLILTQPKIILGVVISTSGKDLLAYIYHLLHKLSAQVTSL